MRVDEYIRAVDNVISAHADRRFREARTCTSMRSKKHMQVRADEAGQILKEVRALIANFKELEKC